MWWITDEIVKMITERKTIRERDSAEYKMKNEEIQKVPRSEGKCKTIEEKQIKENVRPKCIKK